MRNIILAILLLWASVSYAQFNGCPPGFCNVGASGGSGGGCTGAIDLSTGCVQPMLGGL